MIEPIRGQKARTLLNPRNQQLPLLEELEQENQSLRVRMAAMTGQLRTLRRWANESPTLRRLERSTADARTIIIWRFSTVGATRRNAAEQGMNGYRWRQAIALLRAAKAWGTMDTLCISAESASKRLDAHLARIKGGMDTINDTAGHTKSDQRYQ